MPVTWCVVLVALKSFDSVAAGDILNVELTERWAHLIASDYVRLVDRWPLPDTQSASTSSSAESSH